jgi:hypothetical protein
MARLAGSKNIEWLEPGWSDHLWTVYPPGSVTLPRKTENIPPVPVQRFGFGGNILPRFLQFDSDVHTHQPLPFKNILGASNGCQRKARYALERLSFAARLTLGAWQLNPIT